MRLRLIHNRKGMTLLELTVVCSLMVGVMIATLAIFIGTLDYWCEGVSANAADTGAVLATQKLVRDIQEGSSASLSGSNLVVSVPAYDSVNDYYDRTTTAHTTTYYLSGTTGTELSGNNLWKELSSGGRTLMMRGVTNVSYTVQDSQYVTITLTSGSEEGARAGTTTVTTAVQLRN
ncbi:MAG: hypothetical protein Q7N50_08160 [Armatimonadota bacterium]|nr:hypothetical protein [Armatimonadota bacterium]